MAERLVQCSGKVDCLAPLRTAVNVSKDHLMGESDGTHLQLERCFYFGSPSKPKRAKKGVLGKHIFFKTVSHVISWHASMGPLMGKGVFTSAHHKNIKER